MSYNKVILLGNLTRDPQLKYLPSQMAVVEIGIAVSRKFKTASGEEREEVCFVDCTSFGKQAEVINKYFTKGKPIFIDGRLKYDTWEDKQGGGKRSKHTVVIDRFEFVGGRDGGGGGGGNRADENSAPRAQPNRPAPQQSAPPPEAPYGDEQQFKEDDIPF